MIGTAQPLHLLRLLLKDKSDHIKEACLRLDPLNPEDQAQLLRMQGQYRLLEELSSEQTLEKIFG